LRVIILVVNYNVTIHKILIPTYALVDYELIGLGFVDKKFICQQFLPLHPFSEEHILEVIDDHSISFKNITHLI
jgi:hypothetical protein